MSDQPKRVEVHLPAAHTPVQARCGGTAGVAGFEHPEWLAAHYRCPRMYLRDHRFVGGAQPIGMLHRHHAASGELSGGYHNSVAGRQYRRAHGGGQIDPAVTGPVLARRRLKRSGHARPPGQGPAVVAPGRCCRADTTTARGRGRTRRQDSNGGEDTARQQSPATKHLPSLAHPCVTCRRNAPPCGQGRGCPQRMSRWRLGVRVGRTLTTRPVYERVDFARLSPTRCTRWTVAGGPV